MKGVVFTTPSNKPVAGEIAVFTHDDGSATMRMFNGTSWVDLDDTSNVTGKFIVVDYKVDRLTPPPPNNYIVDVDQEIMNWIRDTQPVYSWKYYDSPAFSHRMDRIIASKELLVMIKLTWGNQ